MTGVYRLVPTFIFTDENLSPVSRPEMIKRHYPAWGAMEDFLKIAMLAGNTTV